MERDRESTHLFIYQVGAFLFAKKYLMLKKISLTTDFPRSFGMTSLFPHNKIPSQQNLSDLFVQLESLLTTTFNPLTTLLTTNFLKPWQSLAISGRTFSSGISRSQRFWQLLATPEYKRKRRGRTFE